MSRRDLELEQVALLGSFSRGAGNNAVTTHQLFAAFTASLGGLSLGAIVAYTSPALPSLKTSPEFANWTHQEISWFASVAPLAALLGCTTTGFCTPLLGRKGAMLCLTLPLFLGHILVATGTNLAEMLSGRILCGFAGGAYSAIVPVYINETATEEVRGRLGLLNTIAIPVGMSITYIAGSVLEYNTLALFLSSFPVVMLGLLFFVVESPRHYLCNGKVDKARETLQWLRQEHDVDEELTRMRATVRATDDDDLTFGVIFSSPAILKPMFLCIVLMIFLAASGIDTLMVYSYEIFRDSGTSISPIFSTITVGLVQLLGIALSSVGIDHFGRRPLILISEGSMTLCLGALGVYFHLSRSDPSLVGTWGWVPLVTLTLFSMGFAFGMGSVPYIYLEVVPAHVSGLVSGIALGINWGITFLVTRFFWTLVIHIGYDGTFWLFGLMCSLGGLFIFYFVPETKRKTLEEIRTLFH